MITLTKNGNAIVFTFSDNAHYLFDGTIEVPVNSLTLITDNSQMATFKKSASNDIFISATYAELGMSKSELESWFKENACGSTGGGGVTSGEVETMIDQAISGKQDTLIAGSGITISGNVISSEGGNKVVELTQAQYDALVDKDPDTFYIITDAEAIDINNYYNKTEVDTALANKADTSAVTEAISSAVSGKVNTSAYNAYTAATDSRLAEDEEVTAAGLNALNDALSGKQDTLIAGSGITISGNVISSEGGGVTVDPSLNSGSTNPVANSAITTALNDKIAKSSFTAAGYTSIVTSIYDGNNNKLYARMLNPNTNGHTDTEVLAYATTITSNGNKPVTGQAVYDKLGGLSLVKITQAAYDQLATKDPNTLYVIVD